MFPTEREIYHRLRWDPRFDLRRCHIVYTLRPSGTKRVSFLDHDLEAIPWHRIIEFWIDDELAWSRPERIDRLDELAAAGAEPAVAPDTVSIAPYAFANAVWAPGRIAMPAVRASLRAITWNLLFDRFDSDILGSDERWQDALDRLAVLDADAIVLVEITPAMWQRVLAQPWVRGYAVSHAPATPHLEPFGQVVLSRYPIRELRLLELARRRQAVIATVEIGERAVGVAALHLTSDKSADAVVLRDAQLGGVLAHVAATPRDAWIVAGDFNAVPEVHAAAIAAVRAVDAWEVTRPDEPGHTFDAVANPLAAVTSSTRRCTRLDRILAIGLRPTSARLIGVEPGPTGYPPSDHYGVCAEFAVAPVAASDLTTAPTTRRSSLAIVPPLEAWGAIQRVRCTSERGFGRWPPHITLAHPFVDDAWLDRALGVLRTIAAGVAPFPLVLERIAPIAPNSRTIVMFPDRQASRAIARIHATVREVMPDPDGDGSYLPHLTVARDIDARTISPFTVAWRVDRLTILREDNDRFEIAHEIMLGAGAPPARAAPEHRHDAVIEQVREIVQLVDPSATVEPYGSMVYAPEHARDVDLAIEIDQPVDHFAGELAGLAELEPAGSSTHLRGRIGDALVDLSISTRSAPDERMLAGPRDGRALRQHLVDHGRHAAFLEAWPGVRRFVHARALSGNGLGYFGGFGWAMLLAIPLCHDAALCTSTNVIADWFAWLAHLEPGTRLGFDAAPSAVAAPLWIAAPTPPARNAARGVTPATFAVLRDEFRRAARADPFIDLADEPPRGHRFTIEGTPANRGLYEGRFRAILDALEATIGPVVRPWGRFEPGWRHHVTVPVDREDAARVILAAELARIDLALALR